MLIAFEGLPGAGKTTQARLLTDHLTATGSPVAYLPDNLTRQANPLGRTLLDLFDSRDPFARHEHVITDTHLAAAIRAETYATDITAALQTGATVIEDRGIHTIYSYSLARLLQKHRTPPGEALTWLHHVGAFAGPPAQHSIWLRIAPDTAINRAQRRQGYPYTEEQRAFLRHVHEAYETLSAGDPNLLVVQVTDHEPVQVAAAVLDALRDPNEALQPRAR